MSQQQKQKRIVLTTVIIGVIAAIVVGAYFVSAQTTLTKIPVTQEEQERYDAIGVAEKYIVISPTFAFDGLLETLDVVDVSIMESYPVQYRIKVAFDSSHGGFGNREGQILTQVITPHTVDIIVSEGEVLSAVTDGQWDEMNHQYVLKKLGSDNDGLGMHVAKVHDYASFIEALEELGIQVQLVEELEDSSFGVPTKVVSINGETVQVFEFPTATDAHDASLLVSKDGTEIGTSMIRWIDTPHFYTQDKIIVLYVGHTTNTMNLLDSLLDKQFAGM